MTDLTRDNYEPLEMCPRCECCSLFTEGVDCEACSGEGYIDDYDEDPINCAPGDTTQCGLCHGAGRFVVNSCTCDSEGRHGG